jgi:hypothetical protein
LAEDPKLLEMIQVMRLGPNYKPPRRELIGGKYLDAIYAESWKEQMTLLLSEARIFGVTVFGNGATIKSIALVNVLAAGINNPFALLAIADCTHHLAKGGKGEEGRETYHQHCHASYQADGVRALRPQEEVPGDCRPCVFQWSQQCAKCWHDHEGVRSVHHCLPWCGARCFIVFSDVYNRVPQFKRLSDFSKKLRNIFGSVRHSPKAMFETYSRQHNNGIYLGFIKPSECRMAGKHITLLCLLRLKNKLRSTIMSKEFIDLRIFHANCAIIMNPNF